jgi:hypothetical protein
MKRYLVLALFFALWGQLAARAEAAEPGAWRSDGGIAHRANACLGNCAVQVLPCGQS